MIHDGSIMQKFELQHILTVHVPFMRRLACLGLRLAPGLCRAAFQGLPRDAVPSPNAPQQRISQTATQLNIAQHLQNYLPAL